MKILYLLIVVAFSVYLLIDGYDFWNKETGRYRYATEATVKSVGSKSITVSYSDKYGVNTKTATVDVDSVSDYNVGDTITIEVYYTGIVVRK